MTTRRQKQILAKFAEPMTIVAAAAVLCVTYHAARRHVRALHSEQLLRITSWKAPEKWGCYIPSYGISDGTPDVPHPLAPKSELSTLLPL